MVLKSASVLSCLFPARLGFGSTHRTDSHLRARDQEKHSNVGRGPLGDPEFDPFRGNSLLVHRETDPGPRVARPDLPRARANTAPSDLPSPLRIPSAGVGDPPNTHPPSLVPPVRQKRSSFTTFFAFSSKRRSSHGAPVIHIPKLQQDLLVPPQSVHGTWVSDSDPSQVHVINPTTVPSPLRTDSEEYYYSYYASLSPTSHHTSPHPGATDRSPSKQLSLRQHDLAGNPDVDSRLSSSVDSHLSHTQIRHPYAYSTPLHSTPYPKAVDTGPRLRHATSQPFQYHPQGCRSGGFDPSSQLGHDASKCHSHLQQPELRTSMSTPNLASDAGPVRTRSFLRKKPPKGQERWLSAESWWDALFSPSPRFKVKRASRPCPATGSIISVSASVPAQSEPSRNLGVTFPSVPTARPRAVSVSSVMSNVKPVVPSLARSRSTADLLGRPSTSATARAGFEPALETLIDEPTPPPEPLPGSETELPLPDPPLSLEQLLDESEAFEQQRAQWKQQASKSLGNKQTRSFSRARSKSLGERHARLGRHASESSRAQLNLEFLAARTLLGSQSTMPVVHVTKPCNISSHSKAYSHSHSQSAYSYTHSSHSRPYSHSHSHSLTTSNSSKSSRHFSPRSHSRNGSWSKTAFLKAGALCGITHDDSYTTDEKVPSSSRVDVQGTVSMNRCVDAERVSADDKVSPSPSDPSGEVGIAISSSPAEVSFDLGPGHHEGNQETRWSSKHTHKSSEYAGPHPSVIDSNLPQLGGASDVSMRHRLPPRAAVHPPIAPIAHPYRSATAQSGQVSNKESRCPTSKIPEGQEATESNTRRDQYLSLSHADFDQYGVGEALVYASVPRPEEVSRTKQAESLLPTGTSSPQEQSPSSEAAVLQSEGRGSSPLAMNSVPSLTNSTIQMVMSAFNNPDDLDEFQDLFYKPFATGEAPSREPSVGVNQVPTDVHSSKSSSPLTHLVCKLSEEVNSLRDPLRTPSDSMLVQRSNSQGHRSNEGGTKFVFMDVTRSSSSPPPMASSSQLQLPIQEGSEPIVPPVMVIPEDVSSSYTTSVLEFPLEDHENDTFGFPVKHGQLEVPTAPTPIQSPMRTSTHLSIEEDDDENEATVLRASTKRYGLVSVDAVRASYLTTSDLSQMSGLSDFPLPPGARPVSILHAYDEATPPSSSSESHGQSDDETEMEHRDRDVHGEGDEEPTDDVEETLRVLRATPRITIYESRRSTFGGSDDMDFITELHQARP